MVSRYFKTLGTCLLLLFLSSLGIAQPKAVPRPFSPPRIVNDYVGLLSSQEYESLEQKLVAYNDSTSIQIAVVLEEATGGENIVTYAQRITEEWGIGQADTDNGVLVLVTTKDRGIRIHTGYGVEGFLTDAMSKRIISNAIIPNFRNGDFYKGLNRATDIIMQLGTGEYDVVNTNNRTRFPIEVLIFILFFVVVLVIIVANNKDKWDDGDDGGYYRGGRYENYGPRRRRSGGWIITSGSSGGFSGGSSGGFGGFGGGSFGGGGASGSW